MAGKERPLGTVDNPIVRFASDLRELRKSAGNPAYRELSRRAHYSTGALSDAAGGRKLPSLAVTVAYVQACGGDPTRWEQRWHQVSEEIRAQRSLEQESDATPPYVGPAAFRVEDADLFFGREGIVDSLCEKVSENRLVAVVGPSGSGKTSLLRAGLVHRARAARLDGVPSDLVVVLAPGSHPLEECATQLAALVHRSPREVLTELRADPRALHLTALHLTALQLAADRRAGQELLLVVDQFEELFSRCQDADERARFLRLLSEAVRAANSRVRVVLGLRGDFAERCAAEDPVLSEVLREHQVRVGPMTAEEMRLAVSKPAGQVGCRVETALVSRVVADAADRPGVLPLVSQAMAQTWGGRRGNVVTLAGYTAAGGIAGVVTRTADAVYAELSPDQRERALHLLLRLVELGQGESRDGKRRLGAAELDLDHPETSAVLETLVRARLVTADRDVLEVSHEALIHCWPLLRQRLAEDRAALRLHRQLTESSAVWESLDRDPDVLYRGNRLALVRHLVASPETVLTSRERAFLENSVAAWDAERTAVRRQARRLYLLIGALVAMLCLTTTTSVLTVRAEQAIAEQRNSALAEKVAQEAVALPAGERGLAAQLSLGAYRLAPSAKTRDALVSTLSVPVVGHAQGVSSVTWRTDGRVLATGSLDHTVKLWSVSDRQRATVLSTLAGQTDVIASVAFSRDGRLLATGCRDHSVRLWEVGDPRHPVLLRTLTGHGDLVFSMMFSPDGRTLATGSYDHTARLWDVSDPAHATELATLTGHALNVKSVRFSPDGRTLATSSDDHTVKLWDVSTPRRPVELSSLVGHGDFVATVEFSPDGRSVATGSDDHTVKLWDVSDLRHPSLLSTITGHTDVVDAVAFSPVGHTLASASNDHTVRLWDLSDPGHPRPSSVLMGHTGTVEAVAFAPDGQTLASASDDHTVRLWESDSTRLEGTVCAIAHPTVSATQWNQYFPGLPYQPPCR
ncbi:hypothetical protein GCM10010174_55990 [Kutzneria viridogrisea]